MDLQHPQTRRLLIVLSIVSVIVLLVAGGALFFLMRPAAQPAATATPPIISGSPPPMLPTPPASLDELAGRYPQIAKLLQDPSLASVYKEFMLAYQQGGLAAAEELARQRGLLSKNREMRVTLVLDSAASAPAVIAEMEKFGIVIEGSYNDLVDIAVPLQLIEQFGKTDDPGKLFAQLSQMQHIVKLRMPMPNRPERSGLPSEAVTTTGALAWHQAGFTGQGVKVGVLDLGFDGYKNLLGKTLPERVTVKSFVSGHNVDESGEVHGAACAEIVHAMAPDAELYLAYYNGSETGLGRGIEWLMEQGVQIISHSANGLVGPMDGTGSQARLVEQAAAKGILWVNSSGNYATDHYRFTFDDQKGNGKHVFPNSEQTMAIQLPSEDGRIILNWNDWEGNASEDYDLYLYDGNGKVVASSEDSQRGQPGDRPVEFIRLTQPGRKSYYIVIVAKQITRPAVFDLFSPGSRLGYRSAEYSLGTPGDSPGAFTVGAVAWRNNRLESFSSQGPTNDNRLKPEITAPDGVTTLSYRKQAFDGTSASTPHVSGAAALVMSRFPELKAADVIAFLESNVVDMGPSGPDAAYGYGRLLLPPPSQAKPQPGKPVATVVVTAQPIAAPPPEPVEQPGAGAGLGILGCLSCLVCLGALGSLGGLAVLLTWSVARPKPRPAPPMGPPPAMMARPISPAPAPPQPSAMLLIGSTGQQVSLRPGKTHVGRTPENEIHIDDPQVSRHHAEITWDGARCTVMDMGSSNGTFINGRRLMPNAPQALRPGDRVSFGAASTWTVVG